MCKFTEPIILNSLHRVVGAYAKIGEYVHVDASEERLCLSVINSSLTVLGQAYFPRPLFSGPVSVRHVHVKSKALDLAFKSVEASATETLELSFSSESSVSEHLEIKFECENGIHKIIRAACLHTTLPPMDFQLSPDSLFSFECMPSMLRGAFASCERSADEVKVLFQTQKVNILARKRERGHDRDIGNPILRAGLKTIINLRPEMFTQISIRTPWQTEFKLREFRVMLGFLEQLGEDSPLKATFNREGPTTPMKFETRLTSFPDMQFVFKFVTRVTPPKQQEQASWLRVGPQHGSARATSEPSVHARWSHRASSTSSSLHSPQIPSVSMHGFSADGRNAGDETQDEDARDEEGMNEVDEILEVGFTQEEQTRGLFD